MPFHVSNFTKSRREAVTNSPFAQHLWFARDLLFRFKMIRRNEVSDRTNDDQHADNNEHPNIAALR